MAMTWWRRTIELAGWAAVAVVGTVLITQVFGWGGGKLLPMVQAFTPYLLLVPFIVAPVAVIGRSHGLGLTAALQAVGSLVLLAPVVLHGSPPLVPKDAARLTVTHANLLFANVDRSVAAAEVVISTDADVLVLSEYTPQHERSLEAAGGERYPFRVSRPLDGTEGIALWSRYPLSDISVEPLDHRLAIIATADVNGTPVRIVAVHPIPPFSDNGLRYWESSMRAIGDAAARPGPPTMIVGDFNASRWHPPFRHLLGRGWTDAHEALGSGFSTSWPADGDVVPTFVRLDHALLGDGIIPVSIRDVDVPGSDHRGFTVSVAVTPEAQG
jgi:endonuclease/exonuclease/phosphatase (EEP) superfamily protein YafD